MSAAIEPNLFRGRDLLTKEERVTAKKVWNEMVGPRPNRLHPGGYLFDAVPDLAPSLEALVLQGYGHDDIGNMFGVVADCVGYWLELAGLRSIHRSTPCRIWDDSKNQFAPVTYHRGAKKYVPKELNPSRSKDADWRPEWDARRRARSSARTHCKNGHPRTPENIYVRPDNGHLDCVECRRHYKRHRKARASGLTHSEANRRTWANPEIRAKRVAGLRAAHQRRREKGLAQTS